MRKYSLCLHPLCAALGCGCRRGVSLRLENARSCTASCARSKYCSSSGYTADGKIFGASSSRASIRPAIHTALSSRSQSPACCKTDENAINSTEPVRSSAVTYAIMLLFLVVFMRTAVITAARTTCIPSRYLGGSTRCRSLDKSSAIARTVAQSALAMRSL